MFLLCIAISFMQQVKNPPLSPSQSDIEWWIPNIAVANILPWFALSGAPWGLRQFSTMFRCFPSRHLRTIDGRRWDNIIKQKMLGKRQIHLFRNHCELRTRAALMWINVSQCLLKEPIFVTSSTSCARNRYTMSVQIAENPFGCTVETSVVSFHRGLPTDSWTLPPFFQKAGGQASSAHGYSCHGRGSDLFLRKWNTMKLYEGKGLGHESQLELDCAPRPPRSTSLKRLRNAACPGTTLQQQNMKFCGFRSFESWRLRTALMKATVLVCICAATNASRAFLYDT